MGHVIQVSSFGEGYEAFLIIDSILNNTSAGGVRIAEDVTREEVATLACEMSLKYAFFRLPRGGAKMGVRMPNDVAAEEKRRLLKEIGRTLAPIMHTGVYWPGMDMNCGPDELRAIYAGAGIAIGTPTDTSFFTALSVENALEACWADSRASGPWTIAIDGFGRVAGHLAAALSPERFRITAISTLSGAIRNRQGFHGRQLAALRAELGDKVVARAEGEPIPSSDVLAEPVDVILPSTRTWVITRELAQRIQARTIVPIANAPYAEGTVEYLHKRGVRCLPGFVTNGGGVFASSLRDSGMHAADVVVAVETHFRPVVHRLLQCASRLGISPVEAAEMVALRELEAREAQPLSASRVAKIGRRLARYLPQQFRAQSAKRRFIDATKSVSHVLETLNQ